MWFTSNFTLGSVGISKIERFDISSPDTKNALFFNLSRRCCRFLKLQSFERIEMDDKETLAVISKHQVK